MRIGVDYYPEHWDVSRWETDAKMMKQAGIQLIRLAEFSWSLLEPKEGVYDFKWLDDAIALFASYGIGVVLCTPTATPPKWLVDRYPSILQQDKYGRVRHFGGRRHYCFNSDIYHKKTAEIVTKLAEHYQGNPNIIAWQIDNEFGNENSTYCYCDECQEAFRLWLQNKYGDIDTLNRTYGTVFWSQIYNSFDEIIVPKASQCEDSCPDTRGLNPSLFLDYKRFCSDSVVAYQKLQLDLIRKYSNAPATTNFMGTFPEINYFDLAKDLNFTAWDNYIDTQWGAFGPEGTSLCHSLTRSLKKDGPMWIMEQQSGPCGWGKMGSNPTPGKLRLWTYQAVAGGADTVVYFRWRAALFGTEQYWHGILNHDGAETRRYEEISQTANEMEKLTKVLGTLSVHSKAAVLKSYDSLWSHTIHPHVNDFSYDQLLGRFYNALDHQGISIDFVSPMEELNQYQLVVAPALILADDALVNHLKAYVEAGGHLVLTYRSGVKTMENTTLAEPIPGRFRELAGLTARDFDPLNDRAVGMYSVFGNGEGSFWSDILELETAKPLGCYGGEYYAGTPCMAENTVGKGRVYYLGCQPDDQLLEKLTAYFCKEANIMPFISMVPRGVEVKELVAENGKMVYFILNHNDGPAMVKLDGHYHDLLSDRAVEHVLTLNAYDVAALVE